MSRSEAELENPRPFDERKNLARPILPAIERDGRGDEIVREGKLMVEEIEEESQKCFHEAQAPFLRKTRAW